MVTPEGTFPVEMHLLGEFNVYNILAATAVFYARQFPIEAIIEQIEMLAPVKGRMEKVDSDLPIQIFIDYAHTPDAIEKAIDAALPYKKPENKLIFLVGTGGNRDKTKRPTMTEKGAHLDNGALAGSVLTMDLAIRNMQQATKCSLEELVAVSSYNAAQQLHLENKGKIEVNADADLVLLSKELQVQKTIKGGKIIFQ